MTSIRDAADGWEGPYDANVEVLVRLVSKLPGWGDKNVQVLQKVLEVVTLAAQRATRFSKKCAVLAITGTVERLGDLKTRIQAAACLTAMSEAVGPQFVVERTCKLAAGSKNPKVLTEALGWLAQAVADFGTGPLKLKVPGVR